MKSTVLSVSGLRKQYKQLLAVDGVSFEIRNGEIVGLLGPNGAGKTSTISMIVGILEPSGGTIFIDGVDLQKDRTHALAHTNFAAVYAQLPGNLTVYQNLYIFGLLYDVSDLTDRIDRLVRKFDLMKFRDTKCGLLSSGEQTRVGLAKALLNAPPLLLLDEPTASLDPSTARRTREIITEYAGSGKGGVLWTSHNMHEVEAVCHRVLFLSHGKILLEGNPKTLSEEYGKKDLEELFITVAREPLSLELE